MKLNLDTMSLADVVKALDEHDPVEVEFAGTLTEGSHAVPVKGEATVRIVRRVLRLVAGVGTQKRRKAISKAIKHVKANGRKWGMDSSLTPVQIAAARKSIAAGVTITKVAADLGMSRSWLSEVLNRKDDGGRA